MINFDDVTKGNKKEHNLNWPHVPDYLYRITGGSGSGKANDYSQQADIDKIYLYAKYPYETKYQLLINNGESTCLKHFNDFKVFIKIFK